MICHAVMEISKFDMFVRLFGCRLNLSVYLVSLDEGVKYGISTYFVTSKLC